MVEVVEKQDLFSAELTLTDAKLCYQCGKCTAGCPVADKMTIKPHALVTLAAQGRAARALSDDSIWLCVSCQTCTQRCPKTVDTAGVIDALRHEAYRRKSVPKSAASICAFYKAFIGAVRLFGRSYEIGMMAGFTMMRPMAHTLNIGDRLGDVKLGLGMLQRGRLAFMPDKVKDTAVVERIFKRCMESE